MCHRSVLVEEWQAGRVRNEPDRLGLEKERAKEERVQLSWSDRLRQLTLAASRDTTVTEEVQEG